MIFMLGLMSFCTDTFFLTYSKMALLPPTPTPLIGVQISLYGNKLRQVEGNSPSPERGTIFYCIGKSENCGFTKIIAASYLKFGRSRQLIEFMKVGEY